MDAFTNAVVYGADVSGNERKDSAVLVEAGRVIAVVPAAAIPENARRVDLGGALLAPGFIDIQVNGGGGVLFNDAPTVDTLTRISAAHRRFGTTGLLPTLISDSRERRRAARIAVAAALAAGVPGILGLHLEGPHLAPARRGVHDPRWLGPPDDTDIALMAPLAAGRTVVTLAPESVPPNRLSALAAAGVRICAGHSAASYDQTRCALSSGITGFTHLFNAMAPLAGRDPGVAGAALDDRASWCGIIVDRHHLHDAAVRLAWRSKPAGKLFLVTDAMPPVGADGTKQNFRLGDETISVAAGRCVTADGRLAGSALDMATAVRNCVEHIGIPLAEALRMASRYPADYLGLGHCYGRIAPGYIADFVILDARLMVRETFIAGRPQVAAANPAVSDCVGPEYSPCTLT